LAGNPKKNIAALEAVMKGTGTKSRVSGFGDGFPLAEELEFAKVFMARAKFPYPSRKGLPSRLQVATFLIILPEPWDFHALFRLRRNGFSLDDVLEAFLRVIENFGKKAKGGAGNEGSGNLWKPPERGKYRIAA
jgi:hypothetical protein